MVDFASARAQMVATQLLPDGITDQALIAVMGAVPRQKFVPQHRAELAYVDEAHSLPSENERRFLPPAAPFAQLIQLAGITDTDVVLDVGCGTGYSTAVLAGLASAVVAIDDQSQLVARAEEILSDLEIGNAAVLEAALDEGVPREAPFDVIVIEGAIESKPEKLFKQLRDGGRLVSVLHEQGRSYAQICVKSAGEVSCRHEFDVSLPPLVAFKLPQVFAL